MNYQNDFFEHETNTKLNELKQGIRAKKEEINAMWESIHRLTDSLRGFYLSEDKKTKVVIGPNRRAFIVSTRDEETRTIIPISLDLLVTAVQELSMSGVHPFDGGASNKIGPFGP